MDKPLDRLRRAANEARRGFGNRAPRVLTERYLLHTEHLPVWSKKGLLKREHYVEGLSGEPVVRGGGVVYRYDVPTDPPISLERAPLGWAPIGKNGYVLFSLHPHKDGTLSVVVHGVVDQVNPEKKVYVSDVAVKSLPQYSTSSSMTVQREVLAHRVQPLSEKEIDAAESAITSMIRQDLAKVFSRTKNDEYWRIISRAYNEFMSSISDKLPDESEPPQKRKEASPGSLDYKPADFTKVQRILSSGGEAVTFDRLATTAAVADFQRELAWQLHSQELAEKGVRVEKLRRAVESKDIVDLSRWQAYPHLLRTYLRYAKLLANATRSGMLKVRFMHRVG